MNQFRMSFLKCSLFFLPFIVQGQIDTINISQLVVLSNGKFEGVENFIKSEDLTYIENYVPSETLFYFHDTPFTGVAKKVDLRQITYITFRNGIVHGKWYDETIWNGHLTFDGNFENGRKSGIWKTSIDHKMIRLESYRDDKLNGVSINYQDYVRFESNFDKNRDSTNNTYFGYLLDDKKLTVNGFIVEQFKDDKLISETCYIGKEKANGELKCLRIENGDTSVTDVTFFKDGKFIGERFFCHESSFIYREIKLLGNGLVEYVEYDCFSGNQETRSFYKPKKLFSSRLTYVSEENFELQE